MDSVVGKMNAGFVWRKKILRDVSRGLPFSVKSEKKRQRERVAEIARLKRRRVEREIKKSEHLEEMALLARQRAAAEFHDWEKKEQDFQLHQSILKSQIRLREGLTKPIDILLQLVLPCDHGVDKEIIHPCAVFQGLSAEEMQELHDDIKLFVDLDSPNIQYWEALLLLSDSRNKYALDRSLHPGIQQDVDDLLQSKTYAQLLNFETYIESGMKSGAAKVVEYWESLLKRLPIFKAKSFLNEFHAQLLHKQKPSQDLEEKPIEVAGSVSPQLLHCDDTEEAIHPDQDYSALVKKRVAVLEERRIQQIDFTEDVAKYQPRKPKYSTRVYTGYDWNKYNRTHYDHDNPPPTTVRGYKFDIFYPDLVDKSRAPSYFIEKDDDKSETCIIRFHAGPPYEDIAFRIINKDLEYSNKKGFKCTFEGGILHLYFNFKRYGYRR